MTETDLLMVTLGVLQPTMLGILAVVSFRELYRLDTHPRGQAQRRAANPSYRAGLALLAFGASGRFLLSMRALVMKLLGFTGYYLSAMNLPEPLVESAQTVSTIIAVIGILLFIRGARAILHKDASGELTIPTIGRLAVLAAVLFAAAWRP